MRMNADELAGRTVYDRSGKTIGDLKGVEIDSTSWQVTGLRVELAREAADDMGVEKPMMGRPTVVFGKERVEAVGDVVTLRDSMDELRSHIREQQNR